MVMNEVEGNDLQLLYQIRLTSETITTQTHLFEKGGPGSM